MKKLFMSFALALAVLAMPVMAQAALVTGWTLDLSGETGNAADVWSNLEYLSVSGSGQIIQSLGDDALITVGDTFTASSTLYTVGTTSGGVYTPLVTSTGQFLYFTSSNLEGYVDTVTNQNDFTYAYTSGDISLFLGDGVTGTLLASLSLDWGSGNSTSTNEGGTFDQGQTDMGLDFVSEVLGTLITMSGAGNYDGIIASLVLDLDNQLTASTPYLNDVTGEVNVAVSVATGGTASLYATPEPSTFLILGFGLLGLVGFRKKFKKA
jgi:hypothetical protein